LKTRILAASKTSSRNTAFPAPIKLGQCLARVKKPTKTTGQVVARRCKTTSRNTPFPVPTKLGKGLAQARRTAWGERSTNALLLVVTGPVSLGRADVPFLLLSVVRCGAQHIRK